MLTYGPLPLSTTPLAIVAQTWCSQIEVYEERSVSGWPTTNLIRQAPTTAAAQETFVPGQIITFGALPTGGKFSPGQVVGYVFLPSGTTSGIQVEQ